MNSDDQILSNRNTDDSRFDVFVRSKINALDKEAPPMKNWDQSLVWETIKRKIGSGDRRLIAWSLAMAASVSMVIAAGIGLSTKIFPILNTPADQMSNALRSLDEPTATVAFSATPKRQKSNIQKVQQKQAHLGKSNEVEEAEIVPVVHSYMSSQVIPEVTKPTAFIEPHFSLHQGGPKFSPGVGLGIDFNLYSRSKGQLTQSLNVGLSTTLQNVTTESTSRIIPFTYMNLEYSRNDAATNKGWSIRTGLLLNNDGALYKEKTVRFSVSRQFNKRVKIGPEVIFTNNFNKAYPGISVVFS